MFCDAWYHGIRCFWTEAVSGEKNESKVEKDSEVFVNEYTAGGTA
jgi:hypothetical protein